MHDFIDGAVDAVVAGFLRHQGGVTRCGKMNGAARGYIDLEAALDHGLRVLNVAHPPPLAGRIGLLLGADAILHNGIGGHSGVTDDQSPHGLIGLGFRRREDGFVDNGRLRHFQHSAVGKDGAGQVDFHFLQVGTVNSQQVFVVLDACRGKDFDDIVFIVFGGAVGAHPEIDFVCEENGVGLRILTGPGTVEIFRLDG